MKNLDPRQMKCVDYSNKLKSFCDPLFKNTPIKAFGFYREFLNGCRVTLTSDPAWTENYFHNQYYKRVNEYGAFYQCEYTLWRPFSTDVMIQDAQNNFNICHGITICRFYKNYVDFYHYATDKNNDDIVNWYLNNLNILNQQAHCFNEDYNSNFGVIEPYQAFSLAEAKDIYKKMLQTRVEAKEKFLVKRKVFQGKKNCLYLSQRELQVLSEIVNGHTAKEAAKDLFLSPKTIEYHLAQMRHKFGCNTKSQLITLALKRNLVGFSNGQG